MATLLRRYMLLLAASACTFGPPGCSSDPDLPVLQTTNPGHYLLGPGDKIRIITYGEEQLSNEFRVDASGTITLPLLGSVQARGQTPEQLAQNIKDGLAQRKVLRDPNVSVEVIGYRPVFILGEVAHPGEYPYQPSMTLLSVVASAGGFTYRAVERKAYVVREDGSSTTQGSLTPGSFVQPGDVIKVYERLF